MTGRVRAFHNAFGFPTADTPTIPDNRTRATRARLITEECAEAICEILSGHPDSYDVFVELCDLFTDRARPHDRRPMLDRIARELADIEVVTQGAAVEHGLPLPAVFDAVMDANMAKLGPDGRPVFRADGKALKPPGWSAPDVDAVLRKARVPS